MKTGTAKQVLPLIVLAQFACTSVWFAGNAVIGDISKQFSLEPDALAHLVSAVQLGFISGTLLFAIFTISDRFSPSKVFFICAMAAAVANLSVFAATGLSTILFSRFVTGLCLAGIYPVGMKIAADYHKEGLGKALGWLVGALVLGTAFPHLVHDFTTAVSWKWVILLSSGLAVAGGLLILLFVADGPHRSRSTGFAPASFAKLFRNPRFRSAALGYFGHMWELYAFWAFVPVMLETYGRIHPEQSIDVPFFSFLIIGIGAIACIMGGYLSRYWGSARVAFLSLLLSGICCLLSALIFETGFPLFILFLAIWGMMVIADSPQFSTLVAQSTPAELRGTALTITNSIGFLVTIISIETMNVLRNQIDSRHLYLILAAGPVLGLLAMREQLKISN
ncbi:MAG: MFS transporter [Bacteroidota bacterium]